MTLEEFNQLPFEKAKSIMLECCGSEAWAVEMAAGRPYQTIEEIHTASDKQWWRLGEYGWMEAFRSHPPPHGVPGAVTEDSHEEEHLQALLHEYYATFGFAFVLFDEGSTTAQVVELLRERVENRMEEELANSANEQEKINQKRLTELFAG